MTDTSPSHADRAVVVVGGGIAGVSAAIVLAERGVPVTLVEAEPYLGGRAGAWRDRLKDGESFSMERGFHAFFRQYYNLRALLRRADPALSMLVPVPDYPLLGPEGWKESFAGLSRRAPMNVVDLVRRTDTLRWRDLLGVNVRAAMTMLRYHPEETFARFDQMTAKQYLDSLQFPPRARQMLFDVFAHSFFNPEATMSAAELLLMFHFYFIGNPEGLVFDVARAPFDAAIWDPLQRYLEARGTRVLRGVRAVRLDRLGQRWRVLLADGQPPLEGACVVLATQVPALRAIVAESQALPASLRQSVDSLEVTLPFAVWRLWLDRTSEAGRMPFVGTTGLGLLDNISLYHLFESESRNWAERTGGAVLEAHAYAMPEGLAEADAKADMLRTIHALYPETQRARIVEERYLERRDCPAFRSGSHRLRPTVTTPLDSLVLAGDFVRLNQPSALMERAATSGMLAANHLLARWELKAEPILGIPSRGFIANVRSA
jgi:isorenieratene synthase